MPHMPTTTQPVALGTVAHDATLTGNGSSESPLSVVGAAPSDPLVISQGTLTAAIIKRLRLTPTTIQSFLAAGVTDPYVPADFNNGAQTCIHVRTSPFGSEIRSLPRGTEGDMCLLVHAGDGGTVTGQTGALTVRHMWPTYDDGAGGSSATYAGFYGPGQRDMYLLPADALWLRMDGGHVSWRVVGQTNSGRLEWLIADLLSGSYDGAITPAVLPSGNTDLYTPTDPVTLVEGRLVSTWRCGAHASGSSILGIVPPLAKHWNGSAYRAHRERKTIYNRGPGTLTLKMNASASAEYKMVGDSLSDFVIPIWGSRDLEYEPQDNFWLVKGKP